MFFRDSEVAFVCFEAGDEVSFNAVKDWIKSVKDEVPTCNIVFVITKSDLYSPEKVQESLSSAENAFSQYESKGIYVTSAKTNTGVQELFAAAVELYKPKNAASRPQITESKASEKKGGCCN